MYSVGGAVFSSWICEEYVEYSVGDSALLSACASAEHNTPKLVRTILTYKVSVSNPMPCPRFQEPPAPPNFREIPDIRPPKTPSRSMVKVQEIMENPIETATMKNHMEKNIENQMQTGSIMGHVGSSINGASGGWCPKGPI